MYAIIFRHTFAIIFSFLLGLYIIPIIIKAACKIGFIDSPDGRLKQQKNPVPYLGGVAVFIPFIATLGLCYPFQNHILWLLIGMTLLLFIGLVDDFKVLRPGQKFVAQFLASLCFLKGCFTLRTSFFYSFYNINLAMFWFLSIINAFNLVDVMDGLCVTIAIIAVIAFGWLALFLEQYSISLLLAAFVGALCAFFFYNKPPAKIYLGDAGSLMIGGFLAAVPFLFNYNIIFSPTAATVYSSYLISMIQMFFLPFFILIIPIFEICCLFIIRIKLGIPFYQGSPHHFSILLQKKGWGKNKILFFTFLFSLLGVIFAYMVFFYQVSLWYGFLWVLFLILLWFFVVFNKIKLLNTTKNHH